MATFREVAAELRPFLLPGISGASGTSDLGVSAWTRGGSYSVSVPPGGGCFQLDPVMPNAGLAEAFACEVRRFSLAAFETGLRNEQVIDVPRALAWPIITNYYAAYFSAHAICRLFGRSVSQLDASVASNVGQVASSYLGGTHGVGSGLYSVAFDGTMHYVHNGGAGGSHELLWKTFLQLLSSLHERLLLTGPATTEVQAVASYLSEVAVRLKTKGANGGNWLSSIRNDINYRQQYGVWYPYDVSTSTAEGVGRRLKGWLRERPDWTSSPTRNTELNCAVDLASSMLSFLFWLLKDLASRTAAPRHFVNGATLALLRQQGKTPALRALVDA